ncbi:MAG: hypothetical protein ACRCS5_04195 [Sphingomonas sp.]|uniref:hypothetical protein n=1 Tax=Sphingomonas sp. TaxID=28214 RepID=UPI0030F83897
MFVRLLLALLLAAFAVPAVAHGQSCHEASVAAPMAHGAHHMPRQDDHATVPHICIGCIPPASLASRGVDAPGVMAAVPRRIVATAFAPESGSPPALPPPRRTV